MLRELTLESLAYVSEGKVKAAVDMHLKKLTDDCQDRPGNDTARKLTLEIIVTPQIDADTGQCDDVNIEFEIGSKVPKFRSRPVNCAVRKKAGGTTLMFNDMNEEHQPQMTIDEEIARNDSTKGGDPPTDPAA